MFSSAEADRFLYKIHLVNVIPKAGATSLLKALAGEADQSFSLHDDFSVAVVLSDGKQTQLQIWDDTEKAKSADSYAGNVDAEIFICDLSNAESLKLLPDVVSQHKNPVKILVASKSDLQVVKDDEVDTIANQCGFKSVIKVSSKTKENMSQLLFAIKNTVKKNNSDLIEDIDQRIKELREKASALAVIKINALTELRKKIVSYKNESVAAMIADIRQKYPEVDAGFFSKTEKMLDRFIQHEEKSQSSAKNRP